MRKRLRWRPGGACELLMIMKRKGLLLAALALATAGEALAQPTRSPPPASTATVPRAASMSTPPLPRANARRCGPRFGTSPGV